MLSTLGDDPASLLMLDRELRGRAPEPAGDPR
jgi:hypothetical protein